MKHYAFSMLVLPYFFYCSVECHVPMAYLNVSNTQYLIDLQADIESNSLHVYIMGDKCSQCRDWCNQNSSWLQHVLLVLFLDSSITTICVLQYEYLSLVLII